MTITTGFEDRAVSNPTSAAWTTPAEEFAYLTALTEEYDTVAFETAGFSAGGRPMYLVRVGHPVAPTRAEAQAKHCVLIICSMHGNEPAPRDGALQYIRDLAGATGAIAEHLEEVCWLFIPSGCPDGIVSGSRHNANGIDLNRDNIALTQPETRVFHRTIRDFKPKLLIDFHEAGSTLHIQYRGTLFDSVHPSLRSLGATCGSYLAAAADTKGWSHGLFGAGNNPDIMRNVAGMRGCVSVLIESGQDPVFTHADRVQIVRETLPIVMQFDMDNRADLDAAVATARADKIAEGATGAVPWTSPDITINPPPLGYALTTEDVDALKVHREIFEIEMVSPGIISMAQPLQPLLPILLDNVSDPHNIVEGARMFSGVPNPPLVDLAVSGRVPSVDCNESAGTVHFLTISAGGPALLPEDVAQLIEYGVVV